MHRLILACAAISVAFAQSPVDRAYGILDEGARDGNPARRIAAAVAMGVTRPDARSVAFVEAMLTDKDLGVRQAACSTLGEMKSRASLPKLREALDDKAPEVVFAAARSLYAMGDPSGSAVLIAVLTGDRSDASGLVSSSLRDAKLKLHDPKALLMIGINQSAGLLGPFGVSVPIAEMLMKDKEASGKTAAALLLATDNSPRSKDAIETALTDKNWTVRAAALRAVAIRGLKPLAPNALDMLDDKREEVRYAASATLIRLGQPGPRPAAPRPPR